MCFPWQSALGIGYLNLLVKKLYCTPKIREINNWYTEDANGGGDEHTPLLLQRQENLEAHLAVKLQVEIQQCIAMERQ